MSGVTDPYQPIERRLLLTRRCLEVLAEFRNPVVIVTKSALVTRDVDVLTSLARDNAAAVFLSVTTLEGHLARVLEPRASQPTRRLAAIDTLAQAGVPVGVLVAPVIPGLTEHELPAILAAAARVGRAVCGLCHPAVAPRGGSPVRGLVAPTRADQASENPAAHSRVAGWAARMTPVLASACTAKASLQTKSLRCLRWAAAKRGYSARDFQLSTAAFRRPIGAQLSLFS